MEKKAVFRNNYKNFWKLIDSRSIKTSNQEKCKRKHTSCYSGNYIQKKKLKASTGKKNINLKGVIIILTFYKHEIQKTLKIIEVLKQNYYQLRNSILSKISFTIKGKIKNLSKETKTNSIYPRRPMLKELLKWIIHMAGM